MVLQFFIKYNSSWFPVKYSGQNNLLDLVWELSTPPYRRAAFTQHIFYMLKSASLQTGEDNSRADFDKLPEEALPISLHSLSWECRS